MGEPGPLISRIAPHDSAMPAFLFLFVFLFLYVRHIMQDWRSVLDGAMHMHRIGRDGGETILLTGHDQRLRRPQRLPEPGQRFWARRARQVEVAVGPTPVAGQALRPRDRPPRPPR